MIELLNTGAFFVFLIGLTLGAGATMTRVVFYRTNGYRRPRLLTRDAQVIGGFALSFLLVLAASVFRAIGYDVSGLSTNVVWIIATRAPAIWAVLVYAYFEIVVIERGHGATAYRDRERPE